MYDLDDNAALGLLIQLLKAMFKYKVEILISLLSSLLGPWGNVVQSQRSGWLVPRRD